MYIRLTSKLANALNGIDVTKIRVGDVIELSEAKAAMLISNGWAERIADQIADQTASARPRPSNPKERTV